MLLIVESIEDLSILKEDAPGDPTKKNYYIEGIFLQGGIPNRNHRVYPPNILQKEVLRYNKHLIGENRAFGELGHPEGPAINLERVSHMIKSLKPSGNDWIGKAKIMTENPYGKIVKNFIDEGAKLGASSRGMGSLKEVHGGLQEVQDDFYLASAADIVADPSAPDAFVRGIMEGCEWVWDNGIIKAREIEEYKKKLNKSGHNLEEAQIEVFSDFCSSLYNSTSKSYKR